MGPASPSLTFSELPAGEVCALQPNAVGLAAALSSCQGQWQHCLALKRWARFGIEAGMVFPRRTSWLSATAKKGACFFWTNNPLIWGLGWFTNLLCLGRNMMNHMAYAAYGLFLAIGWLAAPEGLSSFSAVYLDIVQGIIRSSYGGVGGVRLITTHVMLL